MVQEGSEDSGSDSDQNNQSDSDSKSDNANNSAKSEASSGSDSDSKSEKSEENEKSDSEDVKPNLSDLEDVKPNLSDSEDVKPNLLDSDDVKPNVHAKNETASSASAASSDSDSGSGSSKSGSSSSKSESDKRKSVKRQPSSFNTKARRRVSSELQPCWEKNPDIYGIRRSNRSRKEPERLNVESDSSEKGKKKTKAHWNSDSSSSEEYNSDTDQDVPSSKPLYRMKPNLRARVVQKKKQLPSRRKRFTSSDEDSSVESEDDSSKRLKSRRGQAVSYKEDSDEKTDSDDVLEVDNGDCPETTADTSETPSETIEKVIAQRRGKKGVVGNVTTIYAIEENGDPNEGCDPTDLENTEVQFLIKWKGWSHIHNTWESESSLKAQKVKGLKKVENFLKKEEDIANWKKYATPEDAEYYECQLELQQDLLKSYNSVERIIAESNSPDTKEYYVKWHSLPYAEATWEDAALIERKWPACIREFREREDSKKTPSKLCRALKYRPKFVQLTSQPSYMGSDPDMQLRDYQVNGVNWLIHAWCKENSVILADEMGLGKTIQTICFLYYLFHSHQVYGPFLVVVPLSTMTSWQREFTIWAPDINVVTYIGDVTSRNVIRDYEWCFANSKRLKFNAVLTTYEILLKDKAFLGSLNWAVLMVDEAHRLKNDDSLLYRALSDFVTNHRLLITGTPLQNSLKELWALLHFIMPHKFESWDEFERDHENAASKGYAKLHKQLEPFILRRVKKDVEKSLPAKVEQLLRVEMTSNQKQYYRWILTKNYDALRKGAKGSTSSFLNIVVELKKCCNHSLLIKQPDNDAYRVTAEDQLQQLIRGSGKLVLLDKLLLRLRETGHRVLIFSQMVRMLDILAEYLQMRHFPFQRLDGGIKGEIRRQALDHFNAENSQDFCFLLSTRAGGLGINLATADTVIIFDSDWNPQNDLQAQARAHRIGQKNQVNIYRLVTKSSVEEDIVERAKKKMVLDHLVIQRMDTTGRTVLDKKSSGSSATPFNKEELTAILKFGAADLFKDDEAGDEEPVCDIDEILRRAETRDEAPTTVGDELLSAFKMASFVAVEENEEPLSEHEGDEENNKEWDEIIPENFRAKVEAEEKKKELADSYLPPRVRKTLQQINQGDNDDKGGRRRNDGDSAGSSDEESDDGRQRKRGRPKACAKDAYKGFADAEIRRFVKSYKKFPEPLKRLEAVACDAELQEKPLADLRKLGTYLREQCVTVMNEMKNSDQAQGDEAGNANKRKNRGPSFKIGGVAVNAKTVLSCEQDLEPLDKILPVDAEERSRWQLNCRVKFAHFDVEWDVEDDSKLLRGIYQYGMGSWEAIKMDPSFGISDKILPNDGAKKPQAKHLQARAEYLLKILRKQMNSGENVTAAKAKRAVVRKVRDKDKFISKDYINEEDLSDVGSPPKIVNEDDKSNNSNVVVKDDDKKKVAKKDVIKKEPKKKKDKGPLHITANNEPVEIRIAGDLDPTVFNQCKEMMRPVKKALRALSNPNNALSEDEHLVLDKKRILECGGHIDKCLAQYKDPETMKTWRGNLWYFVSKFTTLEAKDLYKIYKRTILKRKGPETTSNTETSPLPIKKKKPEEKPEKRHVENPKSSPVKHKSEKSEKLTTESHHRENRNDFVAHANRESRDREAEDRHKHRDKERLKERERSKKESSQNSSQSHQYRSHDHRSSSSANQQRNHEGSSADRWRSSSSSNSRYPGPSPGSDSKRKRYDYPRRKDFPREHESPYSRDFARMHSDKRSYADYARYAAMSGSATYPSPFLPYYPADQSHHMYSTRDGRYPPGALGPYGDWPHAMMNHDRSDYHPRDYDRRPPPTNS